MSSNRATIRAQLRDLLAAGVPAAQTVHAAEPGDLGSGSPIIVISSRGSNRARMTFAGSRLTAKFFVDIYTLAAETSDGDYTHADAADVLDEVEAQIAATFDSYQRKTPNGWEALDIDGESTVEFGVFGADSIPRFRERVPISVSVFA
jgi:hypothetical protein